MILLADPRAEFFGEPPCLDDLGAPASPTEAPQDFGGGASLAPSYLPPVSLAPASGVRAGVWNGFEVASSELLRRRELLDRVDRKFTTSVDSVREFLRGLRGDYHILAAGSAGWARYETCYFDTPELHAFSEHVRGRRPRYKVRIRHHVDRERSFLEIKRKTNGGKTEKARRDRAFRDTTLTEDDRDFIREHSGLPAEVLCPAVWTNFRRATFVGVSTNERITVDVGLSFVKEGEPEQSVSFGIIELKQPRITHSTPAMQVLRSLGVREQSLSKYCAGIAKVHEGASARARLTIEKKLSRMKLR